MTSGTPDDETAGAVGGERQREISDESKVRILDAAEELFGEKGFVETSLAEIADRSGISRGSIPWHFTNKTGLLMAVVQRAAATSRTSGFTPGLERLDETMEEVAIRMRAGPMAMLHTLLGEATKPESEIRDSYVEFHERDREAIGQWLNADPTLVMPGVDAAEIERLIYAMFIGIHVQWRVDPDRIDLEATLGAMASLLRLALEPSAEG